MPANRGHIPRSRWPVGLAPAGSAPDGRRPPRTIVDRDGTVWRYPAPRQGRGAAQTAVGGFLTGMVSVGIVGVATAWIAWREFRRTRRGAARRLALKPLDAAKSEARI